LGSLQTIYHNILSIPTVVRLRMDIITITSFSIPFKEVHMV
jgi:hypothetical protein